MTEAGIILAVLTVCVLITGLIFGIVRLGIDFKEYIDYVLYQKNRKNNISYRESNIFINLYNADIKMPQFRKSDLQKEISEKEKEIKILKKQKADMEKLKELEDEREKLFEEVNPPTEDRESKMSELLQNWNFKYNEIIKTGHCPTCGSYNVRKYKNIETEGYIKCSNCDAYYFGEVKR